MKVSGAIVVDTGTPEIGTGVGKMKVSGTSDGLGNGTFVTNGNGATVCGAAGGMPKYNGTLVSPVETGKEPTVVNGTPVHGLLIGDAAVSGGEYTGIGGLYTGVGAPYTGVVGL